MDAKREDDRVDFGLGRAWHAACWRLEKVSRKALEELHLMKQTNKT